MAVFQLARVNEFKGNKTYDHASFVCLSFIINQFSYLIEYNYISHECKTNATV